ncbi:MAG: roadblock/LC7 domain-containing protein [bacterium]
MAAVKEILIQLTKAATATGSMIVGRDGLVLASTGNLGSESEGIGAVTSSGLGAFESLGEGLKFGSMDQLLGIFTGGVAIIQNLTGDLLLLVVAESNANLAMLRHGINKHKADLVASL